MIGLLLAILLDIEEAVALLAPKRQLATASLKKVSTFILRLLWILHFLYKARRRFLGLKKEADSKSCSS